jgi:serine/threonine-protein kinase
MGVVYKAIDVRLDRPVAIKMLTAGLTDNPELVQRFQAEARAQANLNHTNLATLYAFLVDQGNAYMVMEFVEGENFDQIIRRNGPITPRDAVPWFKQALLGIGAAHRVGIIHRDIKPSNLMLNRQGIVKVMDFGIAKAVGSRGMTRTGMHLGTLAYMSPEQIQNRTIDVRTDIYALGVTLYEMLSGHVPFESASEYQIMQDHVSSVPPALVRYYPYAPKEFEGVVAKALAKNPDDRFQTVEEFGVALEHPENFLAATPIPVSPPPNLVIGSGSVLSATGAGVLQGSTPPLVGGSTPPPNVVAPTMAAPVPAGIVAKPAPKKTLLFAVGFIIVGLVAVGAMAFFMRPGNKPSLEGSQTSSGTPSGAMTNSQPVSQPPSPASSSPDIVPPQNNAAETAPADHTAPIKFPPANVSAGNVQPATTSQPARQPSSTVTPPPARQEATISRPMGPQSFIVKHRHLEALGTFYCAGALLLQPDGTLSYACAATNDPSKRCEHVTFPRGSIRQLTLKGDELHMTTTSMGNWDFYDYNVNGSINNAYQAILPFVR